MSADRDYGVSDLDLVTWLHDLGREATPERVELLEAGGVPLGQRRANLRLRRAREDGLIGVAVEGAWGLAWYVLTTKGRALIGLPARRRFDRPAGVTPSGRRARAHVSSSNKRDVGWEVRPK